MSKFTTDLDQERTQRTTGCGVDAALFVVLFFWYVLIAMVLGVNTVFAVVSGAIIMSLAFWKSTSYLHDYMRKNPD